MTMRTRSANIGGVLLNANGITLSTGTDLSGQSNSAYAQANAAYNAANNAQVTVYQNSTSSITTQKINFVNTATITVAVSADGSNANIALTAVGGAAYDQANSARDQANTARDTANGAYGQANGAYAHANIVYAQANTARDTANAAYGAANNSNLKLGGLVTGTLNVTQDLIVGGNIYLEGNTTYINVSTYSVEDSLIYLASNNSLTDSVDIGFMGGKNTGGTYSHTGLARDATDGKWKLFDGLPEEGHVGNVVNFANTYLATLVANVEANTLTVVNGVSGNVNFDSGTLFVDSVANEVGIGTTNPVTGLHVYSGSSADNIGHIQYENGSTSTGAATNAQLIGKSKYGTAQFMVWEANGLRLGMRSTANSGSGNVYVTSGNDSVSMFVSSGGNVGIGTTSPGTKLDVSGSIRASASVTVGNGGGTYQAGSIYSDANWGMIFRAAQASPAQAQFRWANSADSELMRIDTSGNVGIGTTSPGTKLHINSSSAGLRIESSSTAQPIYQTFYSNGTNQTYFGIESSSGTGIIGTGSAYGTVLSTVSTSALVFGTNSTERMRINSSGDVGIGTNSPSAKLTVSGGYINQTNGTVTTFMGADGSGGSLVGTSTNHYFRVITNNIERARFNAGFSVGTTADPGNGAIFATGEITAFYSDDRLKTKLGNIDNALGKVLSLNGFLYEPNETAVELGYEKKVNVGVSAQEVNAILPEAVVAAPIDDKYMTVHYHKLVPLLIEAIKDLNAKVEKIQKIIDERK